MDGGPLPALHDMRPPASLLPPPPPGCNFCGCGAWNNNANAAACLHEDEALRTGPRATERWACVYCDHQSSDWNATVKHFYHTGHGFVSTIPV